MWYYSSEAHSIEWMWVFFSKISQVKNGVSIFGSKALYSDKSINNQTKIKVNYCAR